MLGFLGGVVFTTGSGLLWLDIVDHWVGRYSIASIAVLQCLVFGHIAPISEIRRHISEFWPRGLAIVWKGFIAYVIPIALAVIFGWEIAGELCRPYNDYPISVLLLGGWGVSLLALVCGIVLGIWHNRKVKARHSVE